MAQHRIVTARGYKDERDRKSGGDCGMMSLAMTIGLVAACLTTIAYAPQAIKTWRTRSTKDISLGMFALMVAGVALWLVYGVMIGDLPLILGNVVTLSLSGTILVLKLRHG
jgi:MtN3 and saliva related transmembrane protein